MTFYYHFKDIYDLVEWICVECAANVIAGNKTYNTCQQGMIQILRWYKENKPFATNVYRCVIRQKIENYIYEINYQLLLSTVQEGAENIDLTEIFKELGLNRALKLIVGTEIDKSLRKTDVI